MRSLKRIYQICLTKIPALLTMVFFHSSLFASSLSPQIYIAAGQYRDITNTIEMPLLAVSQTDGKSWFFPSIKASQLPSDMNKYALLESVGCSSSFCVGLGYYRSSQTSYSYSPLFAVSSDQGASWSYLSSQPNAEDTAHPINVHCNDSQCIIVGASYRMRDKKNLPLLGVGSNKGLTWTYPESIITHLPEDYDAKLRRVTFTRKGSIAVGVYTKALNVSLPLVALSDDKGATWTYPTIKLPVDFGSSADLRDVSCGQSICVAVGGYINKNKDHLPFVIISADNGHSWSPATIPASTAEIELGYNANNVSCEGSSCVIVGNYGWSHDPLVIVSNDNGASWYYPQSILSRVPSDAAARSLRSISCRGALCISVGSYSSLKTDLTFPLLAVSQDSGVTWSYGTPSAKQGAFMSGSCTNDTCVVTGQDFCEKQKICAPLLGVSHNKGLTWSFPSTLSMLPADYNNGFLRAVNSKLSGENQLS